MKKKEAAAFLAALAASLVIGCGAAPAAPEQAQSGQAQEETAAEETKVPEEGEEAEASEEAPKEPAEELSGKTPEEDAKEQEVPEEPAQEPAAEVSPEPADSGELQPYSTVTFAMDTVMELKVWSDDEAAAQALLKEGVSMILELEREFSVTNEKSEIAVINRDSGGPIGEDGVEVLTRGLQVCADVDGKLDLSIYPVVRAWGFTTGSYRVVGEEELEELLQRVDYTKIQLEEGDEGWQVRIPKGMEIDLGSVAKGYTSERLCRLFAENGITSAMVNLGGNVQTLGAKTDGSAWRVGIQDPEGSGIACAVPLVDKAIITSGGYERYFEEDGKIYRHIIDPRTGVPVDNDLLSVTIIGKDALVCDGLATSLFVMGAEEAVEYTKTRPDVDVVLITTDHEILATEGVADEIGLYGAYEEAKITKIER